MSKKNKELTFEDFQKLAKKKSLSLPEKIGFPSSYREGYYDVILEDIYSKLPFNKENKKVILDIGCGCDVLTHKIIDVCKKQQHTLLLNDSQDMLDNLPKDNYPKYIPGKFPLEHPLLKRYRGKIDYILCYSVLFYVFANDNIYQFIHEAIDLLKSGGRMLIGDIPNFDKRNRFLQSKEGLQFLKNQKQLKGSTSHENLNQKMDDTVIFSLMMRLRKFGCETYLLPQRPELPMANRREDILIVKR
ncbi:MAG: class I SAM-dependent methyltransferase [Bacteroidia bacterium]|nr:class I SAM-dependent methyltransferase [Bacteroidia bacterium]